MHACMHAHNIMHDIHEQCIYNFHYNIIIIIMESMVCVMIEPLHACMHAHAHNIMHDIHEQCIYNFRYNIIMKSMV